MSSLGHVLAQMLFCIRVVLIPALKASDGGLTLRDIQVTEMLVAFDAFEIIGENYKLQLVRI